MTTATEQDIKEIIQEWKKLKEEARSLFSGIEKIHRRIGLESPFYLQMSYMAEIDRRINCNRIELSALRGE